MRGSMFLAVVLIVIGLILIVAAVRGRAGQLLDIFVQSTTSGQGTKSGRQMPQSQRAPRRSTR